jgi:hypothetical protein
MSHFNDFIAFTTDPRSAWLKFVGISKARRAEQVRFYVIVFLRNYIISQVVMFSVLSYSLRSSSKVS